MNGQLGCHGKVVVAIACALILGTCGYVGSIWGSVQRDISNKEQVTPILANVLYRLAKENKLDQIQTDGLASNEVVDSLRKAEYSHGPIQNWKVVEVEPRPIGLPVLVVVEVQRRKKSFEVLFIQHKHFFQSHSVEDRAGLRNLGLSSPH